MSKRKTVAIQIAEHFGCDVADIREYRYQPRDYSQSVYSGMDGNNYWSAGARAPRYLRGPETLQWVQVPSHWKGNPPLWRGSVSGTDEA